MARNTLKDWIEKYDLYEEVEDARDSMLDLAENKLGKKISDGDTTAIIFILKTRGKNRGYVERQEIHGKNLNINSKPLSKDEMKKLNNELEDEF